MKQIIAMGDGGVNRGDPLMDLYILAQTKKKNPKVMFLPTASMDNQGLINYFMNTFERYPCQPTYLELCSPSIRDLESFIMEQDIIYVAGGQSKSMMGIWKEWNAHTYLRNAYDNGTVLAGGSAGAVCWFNSCITDSFPGSLSVMPCLDFIPGSFSPHFSSQSRRAAYQKFLASGEISPGYAADDGAGLHFQDGSLLRAISNAPHAQCHALSIENGVPRRDALPTCWLGMSEAQNELIWNSLPFSNKNV